MYHQKHQDHNNHHDHLLKTHHDHLDYNWWSSWLCTQNTKWSPVEGIIIRISLIITLIICPKLSERVMELMIMTIVILWSWWSMWTCRSLWSWCSFLSMTIDHINNCDTDDLPQIIWKGYGANFYFFKTRICLLM